MARGRILRRFFLRAAAGAAGAALTAGQLGLALAQPTPEGLVSGRPIKGRLGVSSSGRTAEYTFDYPGNEVVYTVEMQVMPESLFPLVGFQVYNPTGSVHVRGGAQSGLIPNVSANVISQQKGRYVVQVFNYSRDSAIDYLVRTIAGGREGQPGAQPVPPLATASADIEGYWCLREMPVGPALKTAWLGPVAGEFDGVLETVEHPGGPPTISGIRVSDYCTVTGTDGRTYGPGPLRIRIEGEGVPGTFKGTFESLDAEGPLSGLTIRGTWQDAPIPEGTGVSRGYLDLGGTYRGELVVGPSARPR